MKRVRLKLKWLAKLWKRFQRKFWLFSILIRKSQRQRSSNQR
ncbi:hypothetical protein V12B01_13570 [Vibrio splendidus 12B01]|nr:hypothetical protein V12B01_13570 [Vibrio splendidus 12B01]